MPEFKEPSPSGPLERSIESVLSFYKSSKKLLDNYNKSIDPFKESIPLGERAQALTKDLVPLITKLTNTDLFKTEGLRNELELRINHKMNMGADPKSTIEVLEKLTVFQKKVWGIVEREKDVYLYVEEFLKAKSYPDQNEGRPFIEILGELTQTINYLKNIVARSNELYLALFDLKNEK